MPTRIIGFATSLLAAPRHRVPATTTLTHSDKSASSGESDYKRRRKRRSSRKRLTNKPAMPTARQGAQEPRKDTSLDIGPESDSYVCFNTESTIGVELVGVEKRYGQLFN